MNYSILHHGATQGVTGSCHELVVNNEFGVLVDCGLFQGAEVSSDQKSHFEQLQVDFSISYISALIATHVHIDHIGRLPYLLAEGFKGPIICSEASAALLPEVLHDALKIGFTRNEYDIKRVIALIKKQLIVLKYQQWLNINHVCNIDSGYQLKIQLKPAGHILGSAYVECLLEHKQQQKRIVFSGDLGAPYTPLLAAPQSPYQADVVVLESTYGDRLHAGREQRKQQLEKIIISALQNKGTILIPAFSIGRTQELLYELALLISKNKSKKIVKQLAWNDLEIIVDSPLAAKFTQKYRQLSRLWDKEAKNYQQRGVNPLSFEQLITIDSHAQHLQTVEYLSKTLRPAIVIAASGMCNGGRIVNYLKSMIEDERHDIVFVGYQAQGTIGRNILEYADKKSAYVTMDAKNYDIKAKVHVISGYSAHADQKDLLNFVKRMRKMPEEIRLVHGSEQAKLSLKQKINELFRLKKHQGKVVIP